MKVFETQLPGVGRRYTLSFPTGGEFVIVVHNNGRRETYWREDADGDSEQLFEATESQARKIAEIFDGTYFHPVGEGLEDAFEDARIKWIEVGQTSPIANQPIRQTQLRSRTGVSILAIQRGDRTISNPDPDTDIQAGDMLVVVGTDEAYDALDELLTA
ncbi:MULTISPECIES: cation:proton antiporter regulatory subunit [Halorussus]|uniref:Potassium transporter TrkA n=2 Tax=Halorussus TaxID=1070314 RepID=A0A8U0I1K4_9EURY|nr:MULTISPECIES: TrkA C-terminal domain-containing protein [Halorussus]UPV77068.1 potassium transporter TrkA [Halorussus limi]USZ78440.1 potassium transporter TrkA [Halorussus vallis]